MFITLMFPTLVPRFWIYFFSHYPDKVPDQSIFRRQGHILSQALEQIQPIILGLHGSDSGSSSCGRLLRQLFTLCQWWQGRKWWCSVLFDFSFYPLCSVWEPSPLTVAVHISGVYSLRVVSLEMSYSTGPNPAMVTIKINHRNIMKTMYNNLVTSIILTGRKWKAFHF